MVAVCLRALESLRLRARREKLIVTPLTTPSAKVSAKVLVQYR
jgi:hypothetical protein